MTRKGKARVSHAFFPLLNSSQRDLHSVPSVSALVMCEKDITMALTRLSILWAAMEDYNQVMSLQLQALTCSQRDIHSAHRKSALVMCKEPRTSHHST